MVKKVKDVIKMLEAAGWHQVRMVGDHRIFIKEGAKRPNVVPGHPNDDLPIGTYKSIVRTMEDNCGN